MVKRNPQELIGVENTRHIVSFENLFLIFENFVQLARYCQSLARAFVAASKIA